MNRTTACVIVTFRKPELLEKCIEAVFKQTILPNYIIVVDNNSKDFTKNICFRKLRLQSENYSNIESGALYNGEVKKLKTLYLEKNENNGGAGGFHSGIDVALKNTEANYFWLMDDDGIPDKKSLEILQNKTENLTVTNPIVLDIDNPKLCSFLKNKKGEQLKFQEIIQNKISPEINPFNGTFISRNIIELFGNILGDMFIWGDEMEFTYRMKKNGIKLITLLEAKHYHPKNKKNELIKLPLNIYIRKINNEYFEYVYYRNRIFNDRKYLFSLNRGLDLIRSILDAFANVIFHIKNRNFSNSFLIIKGVIHGLLGNFKIKLTDFSNSK